MMQAAVANAGRPLRVGVVGVGVMGSNHARVFAGLPGTELVGVADPDRKQADFVARTLGCVAVSDVNELLERDVDAITIAAPTHLHRDIALACIARGVHVMVEKPIASSVEEGREIINVARRAGVTLMVGHVERFNPAVEAIKEAIRGEDILSIAITRVGPFPPRMSNVGVVIDLAVHDIDLIRWFTDSDIIEVQPQLSSAVAEREDIALLQFRTASGVLAHINTNWLTPFKARNVTVATRGKYVTGDLLTRQVTECFGFQPDGSYSMRHLSVGHAEPLRSELLAFLRAVRSGAAPAVTGEEAVASLEIATRCLSDAPDRGRVRTTEKARAPSSVDGQGNHGRSMNLRTKLPPIPFIDVAAQRRRLGSCYRCSGRAGPESLPVHSRTGGESVRSGACGVLRRQARRDMRERHRCSGACVACYGGWAGRCGAMPVIYLLRDGGSGGSGRRNAGVCRCRCRDVQYRCKGDCRCGCDCKRSRAKAKSDHSRGSVRLAGRPPRDCSRGEGRRSARS